MEWQPIETAPKDGGRYLAFEDGSMWVRNQPPGCYAGEWEWNNARKHLADVLICGYDEDGALYVRSSRLTCAEAMFLATKAARWAESGGNFD